MVAMWKMQVRLGELPLPWQSRTFKHFRGLWRWAALLRPHHFCCNGLAREERTSHHSSYCTTTLSSLVQEDHLCTVVANSATRRATLTGGLTAVAGSFCGGTRNLCSLHFTLTRPFNRHRVTCGACSWEASPSSCRLGTC